MKFITSQQGTVAVKYSPDEATPDPAVLTRDLVAFIGDEFNFSLKPDVPPGLQINAVLIFQTGELIAKHKKIPINQLALLSGAVVVTAKDTDTADMIADHLVRKIDSKFAFKIAKSIKDKYYQSNIVIEFDPALENQISALCRAQHLLEKEIPRPGHSFAIKRLVFGNADQLVPTGISLEEISKADFIIERRAGEPLSTNRYFCSAALQTREHERILELVERAMRD